MIKVRSILKSFFSYLKQKKILYVFFDLGLVLVCLLVCFGGGILIYSPGWPRTNRVYQTDLEFVANFLLLAQKC